MVSLSGGTDEFSAAASTVQLGLKTGMYYLRTRAAADAIKFTVDQQALARSRAARASKAATVDGDVPPAPLKVRCTKLQCLI